MNKPLRGIKQVYCRRNGFFLPLPTWLTQRNILSASTQNMLHFILLFWRGPKKWKSTMIVNAWSGCTHFYRKRKRQVCRDGTASWSSIACIMKKGEKTLSPFEWETRRGFGCHDFIPAKSQIRIVYFPKRHASQALFSSDKYPGVHQTYCAQHKHCPTPSLGSEEDSLKVIR